MEEQRNIFFGEGEHQFCKSDFSLEDELLKRINKANKEIKPFEIKRNQKQKNGSFKEVKTDYATVSERIKAFRKVYPNGKLESKADFTDHYIMFETKAYDGEGNLLAVAHARELASKDFAYEVAETSSYGRCIGLCGIGILGDLASAEDMQNIDSPSGVFSDIPSQDLLDRFNKLSNTQKANILNLYRTTEPKNIKASVLKELIDNVK